MIVKIKDKLRGNIEEITRVLESLEFHKIHMVNKYIYFGWDDTSSGTANWLNNETLSCTCSNHNIKGDIIILVSERKFNKDIGKAIRWLGDLLNIKPDKFKSTKTKLPFNGFWKNLTSNSSNNDTSPLTYPMSKYEFYEKAIALKWINDNISAETQEKYDIRYDWETNRILIPWTYFGSLTGIVGRLNLDKDEIGRKPKYLSLISFRKSACVFSFDINYKSILNKELAFVFEAEKSCMQLDSMGRELGLGIGSSTISEGQAQLIKSLYVDYVLCFDSDHTLEECKAEAKKLKINNPFFENKVYILYDKNHKYMKPEDKVSPTDLGEEIFNKLLEECLIEVI